MGCGPISGDVDHKRAQTYAGKIECEDITQVRNRDRASEMAQGEEASRNPLTQNRVHLRQNYCEFNAIAVNNE